MKKIVINDCFGGFSFSEEAAEFMGIPYDEYGFYDETGENIKRDDPRLIKAVEKLKDKANGMSAELKVVKIPDDVEWEIDQYDGLEKIDEKHRSWR